MNRDCLVCQVPFAIESAGALYCSAECRLKAHEKICETCGNSFQHLAKRRFCSLKCSSARKRKPGSGNSTCLYCGNSFHNRYQKDRKYCSRKCSVTVNQGESHGVRIHGSRKGTTRAQSIWEIPPSVRSRIVKKMKLACSRCGWNKTNGDFHHICGRKINDPHCQRNLCYLCPNCHREAGQNLIPQEELVPFSGYVGMKWKEFYFG